MAKKICASCGREFTPRPQVRNQTFCSAPECQRERHRQWQKRKRQLDAKYRKVDAEYSSAWAVANAGYWERYRESHPDYADRNRQLQKQRNAKSRKLKAAIQNPAEPGITFPSGRYQLIRIDSEGVANGNVCGSFKRTGRQPRCPRVSQISEGFQGRHSVGAYDSRRD